MFDALSEAELYLLAAKMILKADKPRKNAVCVSLCAHALIRANDTLCLKFLKESPKRHDDASRYFHRLYATEHKIAAEEARYKKILDKWVKREKTKAEYRGAYYSDKDAKLSIRDTGEFIKMVRKYVS